MQEVDRDQDRSHRADQARQLGETWGWWRYAPALLSTPGSPDGWRAPAPGDAPTAAPPTGSRCCRGYPLDQVKTILLPQSGRDEPRVALVAGLAADSRRLTVAGTHLSFVPG